MFITEAYAQAGGAPAAGGLDAVFIQVVPFIMIFVIMWFLIIRPQRAKAKQHEEMLKNIRRGDEVVTAGGLVGKVTRVTSDTELELEIAKGTIVRLERAGVSLVRTKGEPVKE
ncbi:MAG: preprotein translocase subunit YajC [Hyphomicrobiaceae bacterium]|nr:preprotein translocase subunit YajC [Hyphomicrobiaceae bacterium]